MALKLGSLFVDIGANTDPLRRADKEVRRTAAGMGTAFSKLGGIIAAALSFQAVKSTIMLADSMTQLDQKIKNVSRSAKEFQTVRKGVRDIAAETGNSIQSISTLSQQLLIAGESIGATSDEIVLMTNNLNKLGTIGGSSSEQMSNAMLQFGQSMAGGIVRAEEFNSIVENTPVIAQSIAKGLGTSVGNLRKMVNDGTVLSEDVFEALKSQTESINDTFAKMPLTVDRASGMIANSFAVAVQEIDQGFSVTESLAETMKTISDLIASDLVPAVDEVYLQFKEIAILWDETTASARSATGETLNWGASFGIIKDSIKFIWNAIVNIPNNIKDMATILIGTFDQAFTIISTNIELFAKTTKVTFINAFELAIASMRAAFAGFIGNSQKLLAEMFSFFGADDIADSIRMTGEATITSGQAVVDAFEEQKALRIEQLNEEKAAIEEMANIRIEASQIAISMGLEETEALKKQVKKRIEEMRKEIKARRDVTKQVTKDAETKTKTEAVNYEQQQKNLAAANQTVGNLRQAGLIDARTDAAAQIGISAATAISKTSELGFPQAIPFIAQALATIATARKQLSGSGRANGGTATAGLPIPINERGTPEMFINNAGRQFLLPDQSGSIVPLSAGGSDGGGGMSVVINNNSDAVVSEPTITRGEMMIEINNAIDTAVDRVDSSLATQRGSTAESLRNGFLQTRNI
jgi:tape measure domain-containing protein